MNLKSCELWLWCSNRDVADKLSRNLENQGWFNIVCNLTNTDIYQIEGIDNAQLEYKKNVGACLQVGLLLGFSHAF